MVRENRDSPCSRTQAAFVRRAVTPSQVAVEVVHQGIREYFLTAKPRVSLRGVSEPLETFFERVVQFLTRAGATPVHARCYGETQAGAEVKRACASAFSRQGIAPDAVLSYVRQAPCEGGPVAGVHVWAARSESGQQLIWPVEVDGTVVGRRFLGPTFCFLSLAGLGPRSRGESRRERAASMFREVNRLLQAQKLSFRNVARTWIYLPAILRWYGEFNSARRQAYKEAGLMSGSAPRWLPASTGIQGGAPAGWDCVMDVLALVRRNGAELDVHMVASPDQCEAYTYGSSFSRAVEVKDRAVSRIFVSGTASIDQEGRSVFKGDFEGQTRHTLCVVKDLLAARGHGLGDTVQAVVFLKSKDYLPLWRRIRDAEGIPAPLVLETIADICRPELLVELEIMTAKSVTASAPRTPPVR